MQKHTYRPDHLPNQRLVCTPLYLITPIEYNRTTLLRHFLNHYARRYDNIDIIIQHNGQVNLKPAMDICNEFGARIHDWNGPYDSQSVLNQVFKLIKSAPANAWISYRDSDEFLDHRFNIREHVKQCQARRFDYIRGVLIDRIQEHGILTPISKEDIFKQYPVSCFISKTLLKASTNKVVACTHPNSPWDALHAHPGIQYPQIAPIYHFKWDDSVVERLRARYARYKKLGIPWANESKRFLDHILLHGRINND